MLFKFEALTLKCKRKCKMYSNRRSLALPILYNHLKIIIQTCLLKDKTGLYVSLEVMQLNYNVNVNRLRQVYLYKLSKRV